jgi:hypothetical protein
MTNSSITGPLYIQQYPDFNKFNYFRLFECVLWDFKEAMAVYESDLWLMVAITAFQILLISFFLLESSNLSHPCELVHTKLFLIPPKFLHFPNPF